MSFQIPTTTTAKGSGFSFSLGTATTSAAKPEPFSFGATGGGDAGAVGPFIFGAQSTAAAAKTTTPAATELGSAFFPVATTIGGFNFAAPSAIPAAATAASVPASALVAPTNAATAPVSTEFALPIAKATIAPLPVFGTVAATTNLATLAADGFPSNTTATTTTNVPGVAETQFTYKQIEEIVNKWTIELEAQDKIYIDQATQINELENILISNNHKILQLTDAVQKVKFDQKTVEQEFEYIATQHKELEKSIVPLQKELIKIPQKDVERTQTYLLVENLYTELKIMSDDMYDTIDTMNQAKKGQNNTDPILQIGEIINTHMSSIQWIESSTSNISKKLDEITQILESFKRY